VDDLVMLELSPAEIVKRARAMRLVITDCDGVLTDAGVYYSAKGEELKRFSIRDGMGVERLRNAGIETAIVTGENAEMVARRGEKLKIRVHLGVKDKAARLPEILAEHGVALNEVGYIGDDVNDLGAMASVADMGLLAAPSDAMPQVLSKVHYKARMPGGHGAFRDFAEWLIAAREDHEWLSPGQ
jgi:3-deoxy-D-manno-octulosonate 8-phosphate phosphatase (KDO 8-P phosphatase)